MKVFADRAVPPPGGRSMKKPPHTTGPIEPEMPNVPAAQPADQPAPDQPPTRPPEVPPNPTPTSPMPALPTT
jgi:hypothetical protein